LLNFQIEIDFKTLKRILFPSYHITFFVQEKVNQQKTQLYLFSSSKSDHENFKNAKNLINQKAD